MDRSRALRQLPVAHAVAIRMKDGGFGEEAVATALGMDAEQVPPLLQVAAIKLARLLAENDRPTVDLTERDRGPSAAPIRRGSS